MGKACSKGSATEEARKEPQKDESTVDKKVDAVEEPKQAAKEPVKPPEVDQEALALKDAFRVYDKNGDEVIQKEELADVLEQYHKSKPTEAQLGKIMSKVDLNGDGVIDFKEFVKMMKQRGKVKDDIKNNFQEWDSNGDGFISREELKSVLNNVEPTSDEEIEEILAMADVDKDGQINFEEFIKFFK